MLYEVITYGVALFALLVRRPVGLSSLSDLGPGVRRSYPSRSHRGGAQGQWSELVADASNEGTQSGMAVITSYSIHYTKLYELFHLRGVITAAEQPSKAFYILEPWNPGFAFGNLLLVQSSDNRCLAVITSYSIHYTKLYETIKRPLGVSKGRQALRT